MAKRIVLAWAILVLPLLFTACAKETSSDSNGGEDGAASDASITSCLVGDWDASIGVSGMGLSDSGQLTVFSEDGTGTYTPSSGGTAQTLSWSVSSGILTLIFDATVSRDPALPSVVKFPIICTSEGASTLVFEGGDVDTLLGDWTTVSSLVSLMTETSTEPLSQLDVTLSFAESGSSKTGALSVSFFLDKDGDGTFEDSGDEATDEVLPQTDSFTWTLDETNRVVSLTYEVEAPSSLNYIIDGSYLGINPFTKHVAATGARVAH